MDYPPHWTQFDEDDGTYLFMDNDNWKGNLIITASRYVGKDGLVQQEKTQAGIESELENETGAKKIQVGDY